MAMCRIVSVSSYNKMGRPGAAVQQLEKALALKADFPAANYELGAAYLSNG